MKIGRFIRGVAGMAVTWGVAWIPLQFTILGAAALFGAGLPQYRLLTMVTLAVQSFIGGTLNGAAFALVLARMGRGSTFRTLTFGRIAIAGAIGGVTYPVIMSAVVSFGFQTVVTPLQLATTIAFGSVMGALSAAGSLAVARRAPELPEIPDHPVLPKAGAA